MGQASIANSIVLIPIAANAINELNDILNRLIRIAFSIEAEANYLRQPPNTFLSVEKKEGNKEKANVGPIGEVESSEVNVKSEKYPLLKSNEPRSNIRNQSAITSSISEINSFKLSPNMIANIFEDFFTNTNELFNWYFIIKKPARLTLFCSSRWILKHIIGELLSLWVSPLERLLNCRCYHASKWRNLWRVFCNERSV